MCVHLITIRVVVVVIRVCPRRSHQMMLGQRRLLESCLERLPTSIKQARTVIVASVRACLSV